MTYFKATHKKRPRVFTRGRHTPFNLFDCLFSRWHRLWEPSAATEKSERAKPLDHPSRSSNVVEVVAVLDPFDPLTDFIPEVEQANAALLVIANTMAATKLSNRLDIGSPPFRKPGTCRAATIANPGALDKRRPGADRRKQRPHEKTVIFQPRPAADRPGAPPPDQAPWAADHVTFAPAGYSSSEFSVPLPSRPPRPRRFRFHFPPLIFVPGRRGPVTPRLIQTSQGKEVRWQPEQ